MIRYEVSQRIHYVPAVYEILEEKREVVACPHQCENAIQAAIAPKRLLPNTAVTEEFLAHLIIAKCDDRQPLYHLEKKFKSLFGLIISRQNMACWMIACAKPLMPIFNRLKDHIINHTIASMDATTLQVLDEPNRNPCTKSYVYCFRGGGKRNEVILYDYNEYNHQQYVADWFNGFSGYIHSDADTFFSRIYSQDNVHSALCNAHARRKFESISKQSKKKGLAYHAITLYSKLYKIERKGKKEKMSASQRYELRQKHSKPILEEFKVWLDQKINLVPQQSPIFKAMRYVIKNWEGLTRYLEDGNLLIDNNHTEREIKPFVIARKNFMFCKSQAGARALCLHFSLIRSAKLHRLDPYNYYVKIMKSIPHCQTIEDYEALLPWNVDIEKVNSQ